MSNVNKKEINVDKKEIDDAHKALKNMMLNRRGILTSETSKKIWLIRIVLILIIFACGVVMAPPLSVGYNLFIFSYLALLFILITFISFMAVLLLAKIELWKNSRKPQNHLRSEEKDGIFHFFHFHNSVFPSLKSDLDKDIAHLEIFLKFKKQTLEYLLFQYRHNIDSIRSYLSSRSQTGAVFFGFILAFVVYLISTAKDFFSKEQEGRITSLMNFLKEILGQNYTDDEIFGIFLFLSCVFLIIVLAMIGWRENNLRRHNWAIALLECAIRLKDEMPKESTTDTSMQSPERAMLQKSDAQSLSHGDSRRKDDTRQGHPHPARRSKKHKRRLHPYTKVIIIQP